MGDQVKKLMFDQFKLPLWCIIFWRTMEFYL